jgi:riboflavin kinase/FMN adenylyltransferase
MDVYAGMAAAAGRFHNAAVTIGNFDGVHLGHRQLINQVRARARELGGPAVALTFWPHPARVLAPALAPRLISSRQRRRELLEAAGIEALIEQPFDRDFAAETPAEFSAALLDRVGARGVVVGYDFTYGKARAGNTETLRQACVERGASLDVVPAVTIDGLVVSSTKVREFVLAGKTAAATALLGRPFDMQGLVVRGAGRGRTIGVPTANIAPETDGGETSPLVPGLGVYATRVWLPDGTEAMGACNVGLNPTFQPESLTGPESQVVSIEVHLLDRAIDLYGQSLRVAFVEWLRPERRFPNVPSLVEQIHRDIEETRRILNG